MVEDPQNGWFPLVSLWFHWLPLVSFGFVWLPSGHAARCTVAAKSVSLRLAALGRQRLWRDALCTLQDSGDTLHTTGNSQCIYIYEYTYTYAHIHAYIYIHTYTHTHTHGDRNQRSLVLEGEVAQQGGLGHHAKRDVEGERKQEGTQLRVGGGKRLLEQGALQHLPHTRVGFEKDGEEGEEKEEAKEEEEEEEEKEEEEEGV